MLLKTGMPYGIIFGVFFAAWALVLVALYFGVGLLLNYRERRLRQGGGHGKGHGH